MLKILKDINLFKIYQRQFCVIRKYRYPMLALVIFGIPLLVWIFVWYNWGLSQKLLSIIENDNYDILNNIITYTWLVIAVLTILFGNVYWQFEDTSDDIKKKYLEAIKASVLSTILTSILVATILVIMMMYETIINNITSAILAFFSVLLLINFIAILLDVNHLIKKDYK